MILVPAWVEEDSPEGILAVLGSEPTADAQAEWIPRSQIKNCVYGPGETSGRRIAMIVFAEENIPKSVRNSMGL